MRKARPSALPFLVLVATSLAAPATAQRSAPGQLSATAFPAFDDCNANGVPDSADIAQGTSADCNANLVPDDCDVGEILLVDESFEAGLPSGWSVGGIAHVTDQCAAARACDGPMFIYFGRDSDCMFNDYSSSVTGAVTMPGVLLPPAATSVELSFCSRYEGEGSDPYDAADVFVNGVLFDHVSPQPQLEWERRTIDLSSFVGQEVDISFAFDSMDIFANDFLGWQIDDIEIRAVGVGGAGVDCDVNGVPDECDPDCDLNGVPDACDIQSGAADCNLNGVPDTCDLALSTSADCNVNGVPDECDLTLDLPASIATLETTSATITDQFPDTHLFGGGDEGTCLTFDNITSFECTSTLNTDLGTELPYTGSEARPSAAFGAGGKYFTAKHPGLFVMVATGISIDTFAIGGTNGAGLTNAVADVLELSSSVAGQPYSIYVRRAYGAGNTSVNQVIAIPGDGTGVTHTYSTDPLDCDQQLSGLADVDHIYYALVCRRILGESGPALRPVDAQEIIRELVNSCPGPTSSDVDGNDVPDECD